MTLADGADGSNPTTAEGESDVIRVLLADDHDLVRAGIRSLLAHVDGILVVGEATNGVEAIELALGRQPDVVVMDLHMPKTDGIDATRRIVVTSPHIRVLVLTMIEDDDSVFAAIRAGALGYLLKGARQADLVRAIQAVARGEAIYSPAIAQRIIGYFARPNIRRPESTFPELTDREHQVLDLIAAGHNNTYIAQHLVINPKTVRNHISNIFMKLQVADRAQAIVRARQVGYGGSTEA